MMIGASEFLRRETKREAVDEKYIEPAKQQQRGQRGTVESVEAEA